LEKFYDVGHIHALLLKTPAAAFSTLQGGRIRSRIMAFACDPALKHFYLMTFGGTEKLAQLEADSAATLTVLMLPAGADLEEASEATVIGEADRSADFNHDWVQEGLAVLAKKLPIFEQFLASGSMNGYWMIRLHTRELTFRTYRDVTSNIPKTILRFGS
jgi:hypothetical protein